MFNIGWMELLLIAFIVLLIFGGSKIKDILKNIGEGIKEFKRAMSEGQEAKKRVEEAAGEVS